MLVGLALASAALAGCIGPQEDARDEGRAIDAPPPASEECPQPTDPSAAPGAPSQQGVSNQPGAFSYGGQTAAKTATETFLWQNPSTGAQVAWGGQGATGTLEVTILDACGAEVFAGRVDPMSQGGASGATQRGASGTWTITLEFTAFTGQMGLSVSSG